MKKTVLLGVSGGIAAYKACEIVRLLQKAGLRVRVLMTQNATRFVDPLTFRALTHEPVGLDLFSDETDPIPHISLVSQADLFLIAPCTANVLAKLACGIADDLLSACALAFPAPLMVAPAMNVHMYEALATQANLHTLKQRGVHILTPDEGYLACGDEGKGKLASPERIAQAACELLGIQPTYKLSADSPQANSSQAGQTQRAQDMKGLSVLITAGPTIEPIDAVRFISNHSSGKMGYALAQAACDRGAQVTLISGPVALKPPAGSTCISVQTAIEMYEAAQKHFSQTDIALFAAAVADLRPKHSSDRKLKKNQSADLSALSQLELVENPDIAASLGAIKNPEQTSVIFAAETEDLQAAAREKLKNKHADLVVANLVGEGRAFGTDDNQVLLLSEKAQVELPLLPKYQVAQAIFDEVLALRQV